MLNRQWTFVLALVFVGFWCAVGSALALDRDADKMPDDWESKQGHIFTYN